MLTTELIAIKTEEYFKLNIGDIHLKTRKREIVQARQIAMYFSKSLTKDSLAFIGKVIGNKDHATVLHACKTVNNLIDTDKQFKIDVEKLEKILLFENNKINCDINKYDYIEAKDSMIILLIIRLINKRNKGINSNKINTKALFGLAS